MRIQHQRARLVVLQFVDSRHEAVLSRSFALHQDGSCSWKEGEMPSGLARVTAEDHDEDEALTPEDIL